MLSIGSEDCHAPRQTELLSGYCRDRSGTGNLPAPEFWSNHRQERSDHLHWLCGCAPGSEKLLRPGYCTREKLQIPRGERYELCRSVHAEANAIISASRMDMLASPCSWWAGKCRAVNMSRVNPCAMCKRMIINAGIETVVIRDDKEHFRVYDVHNQYILQDESLEETRGY